MSCDLTTGRLLNECQLGRSGIKTLYFTKFNDFDSLTGITEAAGEITSLGTDAISIYQFDMQDNVGNFEQIPNSTPENGTVFLTQNVTLTLFYVKPADLANLNNLKKGRWVIWALDFQGKIRLFGRTRGMVASGGSDTSGTAPGDKKGLDLVLSASEQDYAPFMADFTTVPFDNFSNVTVVAEADVYGPVLNVSNCVNSNYTTFANGTPMGFDATSDGAVAHYAGTADEIPIVDTNSYLVEFDLVINSGSVPRLQLATSLGGIPRSLTDDTVAAGSNAITLLATGSTTGVLAFFQSSTVADYELTNLSIREVL